MDPSELAYTSVVTILGMGVVFVFLTLLSIGMMGLRRVAYSPAGAAAPGAGRAAGKQPVTAAAPQLEASWLAAAVAAALAAEGELEEVSAARWGAASPAAGERSMHERSLGAPPAWSTSGVGR